jgi:hypothetical protein
VRLVQGFVRHGNACHAEETAATPKGVARGGCFGRRNRDSGGCGNRILIVNWTCPASIA